MVQSEPDAPASAWRVLAGMHALARRAGTIFFRAGGIAGTLAGGSQVMKLLMEGIHLIYNDEERIGWFHRQLRGLLLLLITMAPILAAG